MELVSRSDLVDSRVVTDEVAVDAADDDRTRVERSFQAVVVAAGLGIVVGDVVVGRFDVRCEVCAVRVVSLTFGPGSSTIVPSPSAASVRRWA